MEKFVYTVPKDKSTVIISKISRLFRAVPLNASGNSVIGAPSGAKVFFGKYVERKTNCQATVFFYTQPMQIKIGSNDVDKSKIAFIVEVYGNIKSTTMDNTIRDIIGDLIDS